MTFPPSNYLLLGSGDLFLMLQTTPPELQTVLLEQVRAADDALDRLTRWCENNNNNDDDDDDDDDDDESGVAAARRREDLLVSMRSHLRALLNDYVKYRVQAMAPPRYGADLVRGADDFFVVRRAAVFLDDDVGGEAVVKDSSASAIRHGPHVLIARNQVVSLVYDLISELTGSCQKAPDNKKKKKKDDLEAIRLNKEEEMLTAASDYMATLQEMSIAVHQSIEEHRTAFNR